MNKTKDRPVNMPCSDPEGCKHFKAEVKLGEENKILKELLAVAICPNAMNGCKDGILINPYGEQDQCYWCNLTKKTLK